jgi:hypothetical protein
MSPFQGSGLLVVDVYPELTPLGSDSFGPSGLVGALQARWNTLAGLNEERLLPQPRAAVPQTEKKL